MRPLRHIAAASLLVTAAAALAQDKPYWEAEEYADYGEAYDEEPSAAGNNPWPWPDFMQVVPVPGQYRTKVTLISVDSPMFEEFGEFDMEAVIREGFPEIRDMCVRGDEEHRDWVAELAVGDCADPEVVVDGDSFTVSQQCTSPDGVINSMVVEGQVSETRSRTDFRMQTAEGGALGPISMHMRATTRRTGDCS